MHRLMRLSAVFLGLTAGTGCRTTEEASDAKLVGGTIAEEGLIPALRINLDGSPCTAQHIGGGIILTAQHCFIFTSETANIAVFNDRGDSVMTLANDAYTLVKPPVVTTETMTAGGVELSVPQPDLVAIVARDPEQLAALARLPRFVINTESLTTQQEGVFMAGYGLAAYEDFDIDGRLRIGPAGISDAMELLYATFWRQDNGFAGGASGDSGGPLFSLGELDLQLHGVASTIQRRRDRDSGETTAVWTRYVRLDQDPAKSWLVDLQRQYPAVARDDDQEEDSGDGNSSDALPPRIVCQLADQEASPYYVYNFDLTADPEFVLIERSRTSTATSEETPVREPHWGRGTMTGFGEGVYIVQLTPDEWFTLFLGEEPIQGSHQIRGNQATRLACR